MSWVHWDEHAQMIDPEGYREHLAEERARLKRRRMRDHGLALDALRQLYGDPGSWPVDADAALDALQELGIGNGRTGRWISTVTRKAGIAHRWKYRREYRYPMALLGTVSDWLAAHVVRGPAPYATLSEADAALWKHVADVHGAAAAESCHAWVLADALRERGVKLVRRGAGMTLIGHRLR